MNELTYRLGKFFYCYAKSVAEILADNFIFCWGSRKAERERSRPFGPDAGNSAGGKLKDKKNLLPPVGRASFFPFVIRRSSFGANQNQ
jgi:hypothetical protein